MRIGHYQAACSPGDFDANLAKVEAGLQRARQEHVDILCYPECFLTGYFNREEPARKAAFAADDPRMESVLALTAGYDTTIVAGFNERRGGDLYNTALVARRGTLLGLYSKVSAYMNYHKQGRSFPVFEHEGTVFGVVICSDGGYIEPTRILALKGARIVFAPHYNVIGKENLLSHFTRVRRDHMARAVENRIWFVRGNQVTFGRDAGLENDGVGYGDSYILDPDGEIVVRSRRHVEDFIFCDVHDTAPDTTWGLGRSRWSAREFGALSLEAARGTRPPALEQRGQEQTMYPAAKP